MARHRGRFRIRQHGHLRIWLWIAGCVSLTVWVALAAFGTEIGRDLSSPDGGQAARNVELPNLKIVRELKPAQRVLSWMSDDVGGVTWSSDGTKLAAYSEFGDLITIWSADGKILQQIHPHVAPHGATAPLAFVANNTEIVAPFGPNCGSCYSQNLAFSVFDVASGKIVRQIPGPHPDKGYPYNSATILTASPDESLLAVVAGHQHPSPITLYSTQTWKRSPCCQTRQDRCQSRLRRVRSLSPRTENCSRLVGSTTL